MGSWWEILQSHNRPQLILPHQAQTSAGPWEKNPFREGEDGNEEVSGRRGKDKEVKTLLMGAGQALTAGLSPWAELWLQSVQGMHSELQQMQLFAAGNKTPSAWELH